MELRQVDLKFVLDTIKRRGKENPISSNDFGMHSSTVRGAVHRLRSEGEPICTTSGGYYYAQTARDVEKTINYLESLGYGITKTLDKLNKVLVDYKIKEYEEGELIE